MNLRLICPLGLSLVFAAAAACEVKDDNANDSIFTTAASASTSATPTTSGTPTSGTESGTSGTDPSGDPSTTGEPTSTTSDPSTSTTSDPSTTTSDPSTTTSDPSTTTSDPSTTTSDPSTSTTTTTGDPTTSTTTTTDGSCPAGTEGCPCYGNNTCDAGLACEAGVCVVPTMNVDPYGDPGIGCMTGETVTTIGGFNGSYCAPGCPNGSAAECPSHPTATAMVQCAIGTLTGVPCTTDAECTGGANEECQTAQGECLALDRCALLCLAANECPLGSTCEGATATSYGLCMWP